MGSEEMECVAAMGNKGTGGMAAVVNEGTGGCDCSGRPIVTTWSD